MSSASGSMFFQQGSGWGGAPPMSIPEFYLLDTCGFHEVPCSTSVRPEGGYVLPKPEETLQTLLGKLQIHENKTGKKEIEVANLKAEKYRDSDKLNETYLQKLEKRINKASLELVHHSIC